VRHFGGRKNGKRVNFYDALMSADDALYEYALALQMQWLGIRESEEVKVEEDEEEEREIRFYFDDETEEIETAENTKGYISNASVETPFCAKIHNYASNQTETEAEM